MMLAVDRRPSGSIQVTCRQQGFKALDKLPVFLEDDVLASGRARIVLHAVSVRRSPFSRGQRGSARLIAWSVYRVFQRRVLNARHMWMLP